MKTGIIILLVFCLAIQANFAQNIGIGIINPTKAKLEVFGIGPKGNNTAIFGKDGAGISLQRNPATIGFNEYNTTINPKTRMGPDGISQLQFINGIINWNIEDQINPAISIKENGNVGIGREGFINTSLIVQNTGDNVSIGGSSSNSYFGSNYAIIKGGKVNSRVILNDVNNGKILIGSNAVFGDEAYISNPVSSSLVIEGAFAFTKKQAHEVCAGGLYSPGDCSYVVVTRVGCANSTSFNIDDGIVEGQLLIIQAEGNNSFTVYDTNNINTNGNIVMGGGDTMMLIWHAKFGKWMQMSYSNN